VGNAGRILISSNAVSGQLPDYSRVWINPISVRVADDPLGVL
jgi:hypothetical protein